MLQLSPKIKIINHFDNLINRVDIDIDLYLEKCNDQQILSEVLKSSAADKRNLNKENVFNLENDHNFKINMLFFYNAVYFEFRIQLDQKMLFLIFFNNPRKIQIIIKHKTRFY